MKFKKFFVPALATLILVACTNSEKKDLEAKKEQLAKYKGELKDVTVKIDDLEKEIAKMDTSFTREQKAKTVEISAVKKQDFKHYIDVQGNVDAEENVTALNQQPGIVTSVLVKVGDHVTKGQLLGTTQNQGAYEDQIKSTESQLALAKTSFERQKALWDQKIGSEIQFLKAKTDLEAAQQGLEAQKKQLEMTKIIAPISGTVDQVNLRVGDMAAPSQLMPGIRIINGGSLKVKAKLADSDFGKVNQNDKVSINFPDINKTIEAPVSFVSRTIDPRSRTFGIEVKLNNDHNEYAANMIAKLKINDAIYKNVLLVPSNIIQRGSEGTYVMTATTENGKKIAHKKVVEVGASYEGRTVITNGLNEGDEIITFGYNDIVDGQRIEF